MPQAPERVICDQCGWHGLWSEKLTATHPFDSRDVVVGCPRCKSVDSLLVACDEPGCWNETTMGTSTPQGYRMTCHEHNPDLKQEAAHDETAKP